VLVWQLVVNGLMTSSQYLLLAIGFSVIYATTRFFHFAHGASVLIGAYAALAATQWLGLPLGVAILAGIAAASAFGAAAELALYRPLRRRNATALVLMLASLGLYVTCQSGVALAFGNDAKNLLPGHVEQGIPFLGARITRVQVGVIGAALVIWAGAWLLERRSRVGLLLRAVAVDETLSRALGVPVERIALGVFVAGSALAGLAGIAAGADLAMYPTMGLQLLMGAVVVVVVAGIGSVRGIAPAALLVGVSRQLSVLVAGSEWQDVTVFLVLLVFLLLRPRGFVALATAEHGA